MSTNIPVMTIAGIDPSGGSGLAADLKTFAAHGCYGECICTSVVAVNTAQVGNIELISQQLIQEQIDFVFADIPPRALKTGLLSRAAIYAVIYLVEKYRPQNVVIDPVMYSKSGFKLISDAEFELYKSKLCAYADVLTPNRLESQLLLNRSINTIQELKLAAKDLVNLGAKSVIAKGGKALNGVDIFYDGKDFYELSGELVDSSSDHGAGCTLSAAIAANLALGDDLFSAVSKAKSFTQEAIKTAPKLGSLPGSHGPLNHFAQPKYPSVK